MNEQNRLLLISPAYPPPFIGGSSVYMHTLVENSDFRFDILTAKLPKNEIEIVSDRHTIYRKKLVHFSIQPSKSLLFISYIYQLCWIFFYRKKRKYSTIFANAEVIQNSLIIILGNLLGFKVVPISYSEEITVPLNNKTIKSKLKKILLKYAYPKAYRHISCCHYAKSLLIDKIMVERKKIDIIPISFNKEKIKFSIDKKINLKSQNIISVGRLVERKGFIELIDAVKELKKDQPLVSHHLKTLKKCGIVKSRDEGKKAN